MFKIFRLIIAHIPMGNHQALAKAQACQTKILRVPMVFVCSLLLFASCKTGIKLRKDNILEINLGEVKIQPKVPYKGFETKDFDLIHMKLSVRPVWRKRQLEGTAILTLSPHAYRQSTVSLDAKDFEIKSVEIVNTKGEFIKKPRYIYNGRKLEIAVNNLDAMDYTYDFINGEIRDINNFSWYGPGDTFNLKIIYTAKPEDQYKDSIITKKMQQGLYFINPGKIDSTVPREVWSQGETEHNSAWFPTIEATNQKFTQEIDITVDTSLLTLSNGTLTSSLMHQDGTRTDYWVLNKPHSPYLAMMAAGEFTMIKDKWRDSIPVNYYVEKEYAPYARMIFGHTPLMIEYFSKLLKYDFPWPKYSQMVVRDFTSGAMENTTAVLMYEPMQHDDRGQLDYTGEETISHELFHHWFGDLVTCKSWANLALNESFASWAESVWQEHEYGKDEADCMRKTALDAYLNEALYHKSSIIDHYYNDPEDLFDRHRYEKGALVINMLRNFVGDTVFFKALHNYLMDHAWKNVELADLREAMENASGKDLNWFFTQWFDEPGHPVLEITQEYKPGKHKLYLYIKQTQKDDKIPLFNMPVTIRINGYKGTFQVMKEFHEWIRHEKDTFVFDIDRPENICFDPDHVLLTEKSETKPAEQWYYQYFHAKNNFRNRLEALAQLAQINNGLQSPETHKLFESALTDDFWYIRKETLQLLSDRHDSVYKPLLPVIEKMAANDKKSAVRAWALGFLQEKENSKALGIYFNALNDSSYIVVATAIRNIFSDNPREDSAKLVRMLKKYESLRNNEVKLALANVYAWYGDVDKTDFFKSLRTSGNQFYGFYRRFLERMPAKDIRNQEAYILSLDKYAKTAWDLSLYQNFLNQLVINLKKRENDPNKVLCRKLADAFREKSLTLVIKY